MIKIWEFVIIALLDLCYQQTKHIVDLLSIIVHTSMILTFLYVIPVKMDLH